MDFDKPKVYGDTFISDGLVICLKANSQNWKHVGDTCQRKKMLGTLAREKKHVGDTVGF